LVQIIPQRVGRTADSPKPPINPRTETGARHLNLTGAAAAQISLATAEKRRCDRGKTFCLARVRAQGVAFKIRCAEGDRRSAPQDRAVAGRARFSCRAARHLPSAERRAMIAPEARLSVTRQCALLGIARSSFYYRPQPEPTKCASDVFNRCCRPG